MSLLYSIIEDPKYQSARNFRRPKLLIQLLSHKNAFNVIGVSQFKQAHLRQKSVPLDAPKVTWLRSEMQEKNPKRSNELTTIECNVVRMAIGPIIVWSSVDDNR